MVIGILNFTVEPPKAIIGVKVWREKLSTRRFRQYTAYVLFIDEQVVCSTNRRNKEPLRDFVSRTSRFFEYRSYTLRDYGSKQLYKYHGLQ